MAALLHGTISITGCNDCAIEWTVAIAPILSGRVNMHVHNTLFFSIQLKECNVNIF